METILVKTISIKLSSIKWILLIICVMQIFNVNAQNTDSNYVKGQLLFKIKDNIPLNFPEQLNIDLKTVPFLQNLIKAYDLKKLTKPFFAIKNELLQRTFHLAFDETMNSDALIASLIKTGLIEYAEKVPVEKFAYTPDDPRLVDQWHLRKINATEAWNFSKGSKKIKVAVIDTGADYDHWDLKDNIWTNPNEIAGNGIDDDKNGYIDDIHGYDTADKDGDPIELATSNYIHGTHTAGLVGAVSDNSLGIASTGYNVSVIPVKVCTDATPNTPVNSYEGLAYAIAAGADVISMSLGSAGNNTTTYYNLVKTAAAKGIVMVGAAGNNGNTTKNYPGAFNEFICIASTDSNDVLSSTSCYGAWVDLCSPGVKILSTVPTGAPQHPTGLVAYSGTSMATPIVSGLCALMLSLDSTLTPDQIRNCLLSSAVDISALNPTKNGLIGKGRIDAAAGMRCVANITTSLNAEKKSGNIATVFPNPNNGSFNVKINSNERSNYVLEVINTLGQVIYRAKLETHHNNEDHLIEMKDISSGLYTLTLSDKDKLFVKKISIQ